MSHGGTIGWLASAALVGAAVVVQTGEDAPAGALDGLGRDLTAIADQARASVVTVAAFVRDDSAAEDAPAPSWSRLPAGEYPGFRRIGAGSGIVVSSNGDILTNRHLLVGPDGAAPDLVDVETADGRHTLSRIVGLEPTLNLAVVRLEIYSERNPPAFEPIEFGDSASLAVGGLAIPIGDPWGPERFFGLGVVAGLPDRQCYQEQLAATYLQIAAQVPPGAYGGGLLDADGRYVGMLTPRDASSPDGTRGLEYALPSDVVRGIFAAILETESTVSPWLGFAVMGIAELRAELGASGFAALARPRSGIYVESVFTPSPASAAGIRAGDFVTHIDGEALGSPLDFQRRLYLGGIGGTLRVDLFRDGEPYTVELKIEPRPEEAVTR